MNATNSGKIYDESQNNEVINFKEIIYKAISKWYLFGICGLIGLAGAYTFNKVIQPRYEIKATLIAANNQENIDFDNIFQNVGIRPQTSNIQNHLGILSSYSLTRQALGNLEWKISWYEDAVVTKIDLYKYAPFEIIHFNPLMNLPNIPVKISPIDINTCKISVNDNLKINGTEKLISFETKYSLGDTLQNEYFNFVLDKKTGSSIDVEKDYVFVFNDIEDLAKIYQDRLTVELINLDADIIGIKIEGNQPEREVDYINELSRVFINYELRQKNQQSENTVNFIDSQLIGIVDSLQSAGRSFTNFRSRNQIIDLSQEAGLVMERLETLESEESQAQMRLEYYENLLTYLGDPDIMEQVIAPSVVGITDPSLNTMVVTLGELYSKKSSLSFSVQEKNPTLLALENDIHYMRQSLEENLRNLISNAKIQLESLADSKKQLNRELTQLPKTEQDLVNIKRQFDLNNELYTFLLQKRAEAAITEASNVSDVRVLDYAQPETVTELGPNKMLNFIIGLLAGIGIPFIIIVIIHYFDKTIKTKEDIEKETNIPVLTIIGHDKKNNYLPVVSNPHSGISESFRILRTNLVYLSGRNNQKVIAIHSTIPGEGKTFFASNLAAVIAKNNSKVLLICGDLRKPKLHMVFKVSNELGLSNYLINKNNIDEVVFNTQIKNLAIIPSGPTPPNPAELLSNGKIEKLIEKAKEYFEYIIIDNSPATIVTDGIIIGKLADINLFVTRSEYTSKDQVKMIDHLKNQGIIQNISIVLNDLEHRRAGYHYSYKKGYGVQSKEKTSIG